MKAKEQVDKRLYVTDGNIWVIERKGRRDVKHVAKGSTLKDVTLWKGWFDKNWA